jgi:hypothetical protein
MVLVELDIVAAVRRRVVCIDIGLEVLRCSWWPRSVWSQRIKLAPWVVCAVGWNAIGGGESEVDAIQLALRKRNYRGLCKQPGIFADFQLGRNSLAF